MYVQLCLYQFMTVVNNLEMEIKNIFKIKFQYYNGYIMVGYGDHSTFIKSL